MPENDSHDLQRRSFLKAASVAGALTAVGSGVTVATPGRAPGPKENEVLVGVSAGKDLVGTVAPHVPGNADIVHENDTLRYVAVSFPDAASNGRRKFKEAVTKQRGVKYAEDNATHTTSLTPNDPRFGDQYAPQLVNAPAAWDTTQGSSGVVLAVVDTGAQYTHPDLDGNYRSNPGRDFVDDDSDPAPDVPSDEFHATHVSGIAGAETDNGEGVAGISDCTLINGRALDESGRGSTSDIADAIMWAADEGAEAVNLSLGGGGFTQTMKNAVSYAVSNGCQPIAAAGNAGANSVDFPAGYSESIAVSAIDSGENIASFSNTGSEVELAAPGVDVLSTTTGARGSYELLSGTSMATPVVTGVAGLVESAHGDLSPNELRNHLKGTAVDIGLTAEQQGCGRVDAQNAVETAPADRTSDCGAGDGGGGGGGGGTCGDRSTNGSVTDSLAAYWDSDCWTWSWEFSDPCEVVIELDGPADADFDLYVNEGFAQCPSPSSFTHRSISTNSQERITIQDPDTSTDLFILADSYFGSGTYTLTITERST